MAVMNATLARILVWKLARMETPITFSREGLDDECFFCCAFPQYEADERMAVHQKNCLWVRARQVCGMDLGAHRVHPD